MKKLVSSFFLLFLLLGAGCTMDAQVIDVGSDAQNAGKTNPSLPLNITSNVTGQNVFTGEHILRFSRDEGKTWSNIDKKTSEATGLTSQIRTITDCLVQKICLGGSDSNNSSISSSAIIRILRSP